MAEPYTYLAGTDTLPLAALRWEQPDGNPHDFTDVGYTFDAVLVDADDETTPMVDQPGAVITAYDGTTPVGGYFGDLPPNLLVRWDAPFTLAQRGTWNLLVTYTKAGATDTFRKRHPPTVEIR